MSGIPGFGNFASGPYTAEDQPVTLQISSDDELELALPSVNDNVENDVKLEIDQSIVPVGKEEVPKPPHHAVPKAHLVASSSFKPPFSPSVPQDLSIIAELVKANQVVGSLPPISITAAEKRKQVEASIRAKTLALQAGKVEPKGNGESLSTVELNAVSEIPAASTSPVKIEKQEDSRNVTPEGLAAARIDNGLPGPSAGMTMAERDAIEIELDRLVGKPPAPEEEAVNPGLGSESDSDSSSEYESDSSSEEDSEEGDLGDGDAGPEGTEFVFSGSPAPSPRKRPMHFEVIDDDEEPVSSDPILSANEAPLPPVPQPPFLRLPEGERLSLAGEIVSWMKEKKVEAWWENQRRAESQVEAETLPDAGKADVSEKDGLAGEAGVESGQTKQAANILEEGQVSEEPATAVQMLNKPMSSGPVVDSAKVPKFPSSGTVVVRAMQERPGQEGWLEEGSVVCYLDGQVLGFVSDTFGPLTSPFYSIRLPPPPFPFPSAASLALGARLFYPVNPQYRSFVNMVAVQDPRFKGSDASNIHDEEVGEDEMEWSDDEAEAAAKQRRKNKRSESRGLNGNHGDSGGFGQHHHDRRSGSDVGGSGRRRGSTASTAVHGLPLRPHFDYTPDDGSDAAGYYDEEGMTEFDGGGSADGDLVSEAGSSASRRTPPMPYDLDEPGQVGGLDAFRQEKGAKRGRDQGGERGRSRDERGHGRGRGRGQGRDRGGGRGGGIGGKDGGGRPPGNHADRRNDRGGRGGGVGRGGRGGRGSAPGSSSLHAAGSAGLPSKPTFDAVSSQGPMSHLQHGPGLQAPFQQPMHVLPTPTPAAFGHTPAQSYRPNPQPAPQQHSNDNASIPSSPMSNLHYSHQHQALPPQHPASQHQHQHQHQYNPPMYDQSSYNPNNGMLHQQSQYIHQQQQPSYHPYLQHTQGQQGGQDGPAINPRFAAQYQQMQMMSQLAAWGGVGQMGPAGGQGHAQGGGYGGNGYNG